MKYKSKTFFKAIKKFLPDIGTSIIANLLYELLKRLFFPS